MWFNVKNGYGFVRGLDDGKDYFAHFSKIVAEPGQFKLLQKGDTVDFTPSVADRGEGLVKPQALNIKVVEGGSHEILRDHADSDIR